MKNKVLRFVAVEPQFRVRLFIVLVLLIVSVVELNIIDSQTTNIALLKNKRDILLLSDREFQSVRHVKRNDEQNSEANTSSTSIVKGIVESNGVRSVLVNNTFYTVGDLYKEYRIVAINIDSVELKNETTHEIRHLYMDN
jgi:hypothetical protein